MRILCVSDGEAELVWRVGPGTRNRRRNSSWERAVGENTGEVTLALPDSLDLNRHRLDRALHPLEAVSLIDCDTRRFGGELGKALSVLKPSVSNRRGSSERNSERNSNFGINHVRDLKESIETSGVTALIPTGGTS